MIRLRSYFGGGAMSMTDLGANVASRLALAPVQITAGGTGDNVPQNGPAVDRNGFLSAVLTVPVSATLAQAATLTLSAKLQHSADGSTGWADYGTVQQLALTGGTGGTTESGLIEINANLSGANRYVRAVVTGDLSSATTDTARFGAVLTLGGATVIPAV